MWTGLHALPDRPKNGDTRRAGRVAERNSICAHVVKSRQKREKNQDASKPVAN